MLPPEWHPGQQVAVFRGPHEFDWRVHLTASPEHYLFVCGQNPAFRRPVLKVALSEDVQAALAGEEHAA